MKKNISLALLLAPIFFAGPSQGAQIQGVTISSSSGFYTSLATSNPDRRATTNLVSSTGLFGDRVSTIPGGTMWLSTVGGHVATNFVVFNLGGLYTVNGIKVWNYNENEASSDEYVRGIKTASISYSTDGVNFTTNLPSQSFNEAPGSISAFGQNISFPAGVAANYIRIDVVTNWSTTANNYVGLSKVRIIANTNPPSILSASENYGSNQVTLIFSESVDSVSAATLANYSLTSSGPAPTISSVVVGEFNDRVILYTSPLTNQSYSVVASGVYDLGLTQTITNDSTVPVQPELVLWLQGNAGVLTDDSGNVTNWLDQSSYGHNAGEAIVNTYTAPPTLASGAINGLPAVSFNGSQLMSVPNDANLAVNGDVTVIVVLDKTTSAAGDVISKTGGVASVEYTNNMPGPFDYQITAALKSSWTWGNAGSGSGLATYGVATSTGAFVVNQYYIVTASVTQGTNFSWYLNGAVNGSTTFSEAPSDAGNPIYLGVRSDSGNDNNADKGLTFTGNLAEVMVLRGNVTPADLAGANNYLGGKYNIPIQQLAIIEEPGSTTAINGQTATFWVNAVGIPPITYQWKSNNVSIAGATSAVYTTPKLTLAANNASYTVTVTTPVATTNSSAAVLTVVPATLPPTVYSVAKTATNANDIWVVFSESVSSATALNPANFLLNGTAVVSAVAGAQSNVVVLSTATVLTNTVAYTLTVQNVQDLAANTVVTTNILVLPTGLSLWLKADVGVVNDTNGNVVEWLDQTVNTNNATQYSGGPLARPTPQSAGINGAPAVNFNAANSNYLQVATSPSVAFAADMSIYAVVNVSDYSAPREFLGKTGGTGGNEPASYDYYGQNATTLRLYRGNGVVAGLEVATTAPPATTPHVIAVTMQSTNVTHYLDGNGNGSGTLNTNMADGGTALRIGSRQDFAQFMNGEIAEIMVFSNAISSLDRTNIDNYLGVKYFPFAISQQPLPVTTNEGVSVTFSVAASQGSAHFTYQWQSNSVNIPNATNSSYTTAVLAPNNSGDTYATEIIVPDVSTNLSSPAAVTVNDVPPTVVSAGTAVWSQSVIVVVFSEAVDPVTGTNPNNYSLSPSGSILSAAIGDAPNKVVLTTSALTPGTAYTLTVQNVMDLYGNTTATASSSVGVYPASTALWLQAGAGVTTDANGVNTWLDQSTNGNTLFGGIEPQLVPNDINGLPAIRFNSANETYMYANSTPSLAITGDMSIFAVVNFNGLVGATNGMIVSKTAVNEPAPYDYYVRSTLFQFYRGNGTVNGQVNGTTVPTAGTPHLVDVVMQGNTVNHRLDGSPNGSGTMSTTIADTGQPLFIGTRVDAVNRLNGDLAELIILGSAADSNDTMSIETYLGTKYGLPLAPVITQQPVSSTNVDQNSTLVVSVGVTGASPLSLQWYETNGVAVPGQTNATLVISNFPGNASYYLNASNLFGTTNSNPVSVTALTGLTVAPLTPSSQTVYEGSFVTYTVNAEGDAPFYYQWFADGVAVNGATNSTYVLVAPSGTSSYSCTVSNAYNGGDTGSTGNATLIGINPSSSLYTQTVLSNNPVAYWRLNEAIGATVAIDQVGAHNAAYNNVDLGLPGSNPPLDPDTAAGFGLLASANSYAGEIDNSGSSTPIPNIDFSQPTGANGELSVEAWVKATNTEVAGAGLVTKGSGNGGEQFDMDVYTAFRFFVRDAVGGVHGPTSTVTPVNGQWYHLVGVWDGANGAARLYINGALSAATTGVAPNLGVLSTNSGTVPTLPGADLVSIGARTSASNSASFNLQFNGVIDQVALYNYALTPSQVQQDYAIGSLVLQPSLTIVNLGGGQVQLSWNAGSLQTATNVAGPYTTVTNQSPYTAPAGSAQQYYRVDNN